MLTPKTINKSLLFTAFEILKSTSAFQKLSSNEDSGQTPLGRKPRACDLLDDLAAVTR